ncbi:hypothetical protein VNO77_30060 [Canavalia gladiata]|uniref:UTP23 sensor motif region domain-containing protein n=1 Tax=Canavalia gladiata TaxID=3824 RepID=A0AAN9KR65_CANGL
MSQHCVACSSIVSHLPLSSWEPYSERHQHWKTVTAVQRQEVLWFCFSPVLWFVLKRALQRQRQPHPPRQCSGRKSRFGSALLRVIDTGSAPCSRAPPHFASFSVNCLELVPSASSSFNFAVFVQTQARFTMVLQYPTSSLISSMRKAYNSMHLLHYKRCIAFTFWFLNSSIMKVKKQKRHRKSLTFYTACFGFRKPFKVLCDGTFVHHLLVNRITPADKALGNILSATVKLYTTRCVLAELKRLGGSYSEALEAAHKLIVARCEHDKCMRADACIAEVVGENNSEHFFVASQDGDLRKKLQEVPGVPLIFGLRNALFLEPPSAFQRQYVKTSEEGRLHMTDKECQMFKDRIMTRLTGEEANDSITEIDENKDSGDQTINVQSEKRSTATRNLLDIKDKPQFKRKRAKAPNPLSCKKKKSNNQHIGSLKETKGDTTATAKRSRKRKRSNKKKMSTETVT